MGAAAALLAVALALATGPAAALDNGLALTPPMGWNSWNTFGEHIDETLIKDTANLLVSTGLRDLGYIYLNLDDGWHARNRSAAGTLECDPLRFPSGMKALGDHIHDKGLLFGIYSDSGEYTCQRYPGSRGHEKVDAKTWSSWGVDYLKYDNCYPRAGDTYAERYTAMRDALNATGRPILFSMCEWGELDVWRWGRYVGNSWRTTDDIVPTWESVLANLDNNVGLARFAGPGAWNDPDMLEVGVGDKLTLNEQRAHFAIWCILKAPLLVGADLRSIHSDSLAILQSKEVIAINQDSLGVAGDLIWKEGALEIYASPLSGGRRAVVMLNRHSGGPASRITVRFSSLGYPAGSRAVVRDLYAGKDLGTFRGGYTAQVEQRDVVVLSITPVEAVRTADAWRPWSRQPIYTGDDMAAETLAEAAHSALGRRGSRASAAAAELEFSVS